MSTPSAGDLYAATRVELALAYPTRDGLAGWMKAHRKACEACLAYVGADCPAEDAYLYHYFAVEWGPAPAWAP